MCRLSGRITPAQFRLVEFRTRWVGVGVGGTEKRLNRKGILETKTWTQRADLALTHAA